MQVFADDGARIDVRTDGNQHHDAVVLIHGFPFTSEIWSSQAHALSSTHFVIRVDLRGAGKSEISQGPYLMETLASDVAAVLDALSIQRAAVVGHSMGGYVAMAFARMFTERVARLGLIAARLRDDTDEQARSRRELADRAERAGDIEPIVQAFLPRLFAPQTLARDPAAVERAYAIARSNNASGAAAALRGMALRASSEDFAEDLPVAVLAIAGACDATFAVTDARDDAARFASSEFVVCDSSGHLPMLEEPLRLSEALAGWL